MKKVLLISCVPIIVLSFFIINVIYKPEPVHVSMLTLLANPEKYDGKVVRVEGVGRLEFENTNLYVNLESQTEGIFRDTIWLVVELSSEECQDMIGLNGQYVTVEGIYNMKNKGHFDGSNGAIENITRYELVK